MKNEKLKKIKNNKT